MHKDIASRARLHVLYSLGLSHSMIVASTGSSQSSQQLCLYCHLKYPFNLSFPLYFIGSNCLVAFLFTTGSVRYSLHSICIMLWLFYRPWVNYLIKLGYFLFIYHVRNAKVCILTTRQETFLSFRITFCCFLPVFLLFSMKSISKQCDSMNRHYHTWNRKLLNHIPSALWKLWTGKNEASELKVNDAT